MDIVAGCVVKKDNKILMVQESNEKYYGQWNFPAGHVDEGENIMEVAIREVKEETGCDVKLTGLLPIKTVYQKGIPTLIVEFTAEILNENIQFDKNEILDVKWIDIEDIKNMDEKTLRAIETNKATFEDFINNKIYPLDIFDTKKYVL